MPGKSDWSWINRISVICSVAEPEPELEPSEPCFFGLAGARARTFWSGSGSDFMGFRKFDKKPCIFQKKVRITC